ncbi:hypothetical protein [Nocardia sp. CS682]|uniref:hypothetical protein n=1 Tax=Nocardia sp. CS682 TaxID=1047172 RepID=UPI001075722A|nr:hypothetical protein [Nocardia sp. CS682]QBS41334.1 hypothetical protein DMB37_15585 [Nocardia sp. CS682]
MTAQNQSRRRSARCLTDRGHPRPEHAVPATIWACGTEPIDPASTWPSSILTRAIAEFSTIGDQVALLVWPHRPGESRDCSEPELSAALTGVQGLDRTAQILDLHTENPTPSAPVGTLDLIITTQIPGHHDSDAGAELLWNAATRLRTNGVLVVLTRCDWTHGTLVDPTGPIVADAQAADLLYLQHIAAVAIRGDAIATTDIHASAQHRLQRTHRRVHTDVLVFVQPNQHRRPPPDPRRPRP